MTADPKTTVSGWTGNPPMKEHGHYHIRSEPIHVTAEEFADLMVAHGVPFTEPEDMEAAMNEKVRATTPAQSKTTQNPRAIEDMTPEELRALLHNVSDCGGKLVIGLGIPLSPPRRRHQSTRVHGNMFGYRGVEWEAGRQMFRARIEPTQGRRGRWLGRFACAEDAARAYDEAARRVYGADAYLNFPEIGEKPAQASRLVEGVCPEGHSLAEFGRTNVKGRLYCKRCNLLAARRYQARKRVAKENSNV